jgi:hypothetical protein
MQKIIALIIAAMLFAGCASSPETKEPTHEQLYSGPKANQFNYSVEGEDGTLYFTAYKGLSDYLNDKPRTFYCTPSCPSNTSMQLLFINEKYQEQELLRFAQAIDNITSSPDQRRKIAISLVQNIPYDDAQYETLDFSIDRYPYQVLYDAKGVCGEKTRLLAYILRHQGYGTAFLRYSDEKHAALGIKCPTQYSTQKTGYCFIETTTSAIPTFDQGMYPGFGKLKSFPEIMVLSNGTEYYPVQDYLDAQEWTRIQAEITNSGGTLSQKDFDKWVILKDKYGMRIE